MAILTVYTELLDNTLEGARIIDMGTQRSCACFVLPKDKVSEVAVHDKRLKQHAFYILLGTRPNTGKLFGYIGETNDFSHRVNDHKQKKEDWDTALVFISKSNEIYKSEVKYLEYLGYKNAIEAGNYEIDNRNNVEKETLSAHKENEMNAFFEDILFLTRFYGCEIFDCPQKAKKPSNYHEFHLDLVQIGVHATLYYYPDTKEYHLQAGSKIRSKGHSIGLSKEIIKMREELRRNKNAYQDDGELLTLLQPVNITTKKHSPSGAGSFCTATSVQGTTSWKDNDGQTFAKVFPKEKQL